MTEKGDALSPVSFELLPPVLISSFPHAEMMTWRSRIAIAPSFRTSGIAATERGYCSAICWHISAISPSEAAAISFIIQLSPR